MKHVKAKRLIRTRGLPKTGQTVISRTGDDGTYQAGWWVGKTVANNKPRFKAKIIAGDDVVLDRATGLMWAADDNAEGCNNGNFASWNDAIDYFNGLDFGGFNDWRMPNRIELESLIVHSRISPVIDVTVFPNAKQFYYWSSTISFGSGTLAVRIDFDMGNVEVSSMENSHAIRAVRGGV